MCQLGSHRACTADIVPCCYDNKDVRDDQRYTRSERHHIIYIKDDDTSKWRNDESYLFGHGLYFKAHVHHTKERDWQYPAPIAAAHSMYAQSGYQWRYSSHDKKNHLISIVRRRASLDSISWKRGIRNDSANDSEPVYGRE